MEPCPLKSLRCLIIWISLAILNTAALGQVDDLDRQLRNATSSVAHHQALARELTVGSVRLERLCRKLGQEGPPPPNTDFLKLIDDFEETNSTILKEGITRLEALGKRLNLVRKKRCEANDKAPVDENACTRATRAETQQQAIVIQTKILAELLNREVEALRAVARLEQQRCVRPGMTTKLLQPVVKPSEYSFGTFKQFLLGAEASLAKTIQD
ncbi:hypothetical protein [Shewanella sp.]|uniref:hypothetical protein n=1 Tax=Shewanella sp. TaxID=50422 RepID=UPI0040488DC7